MKVRRSSILIGFVALAGLLHGVLGAEDGDAVFSPAYFWMWNGRLDAKELCAQLDDMRAHGLRNVCIHPFPKGFRDWFATEMEPDYLTEGYLDVFAKVVRHAGELGMHAYLYDEGGWPSGGACGRVAASDTEGLFAPREIALGKDGGLSVARRPYPKGRAAFPSLIERGIHRLVRISPFDANKRRQTSFASVETVAEITEGIDVEIKDEDLRIDTYRSGGAGGQHVNKTDSAVRLTHLPTGIVVACQKERSQHMNKEKAMNMLRAQLYEYYEDQKKAEMDRFYGAKSANGWGSQIRSYVFCPYTMVKDLRTEYETSDVDAVMDGHIQPFIEAWLQQQAAKKV